MRRRIVGLAVLAVTLALVLFGVSLALGVTELAVADEQASLQRLAGVTARAVQSQLAHHEDLGEIPDASGDTELAVYDEDGDLLVGRGPETGDHGVRTALRGRTTEANDNGVLIVAVPVFGDHGAIGAIEVDESEGHGERSCWLSWRR